MTRKALPLIAALVLAACQPETEAEAPQPTSAATAEPSPTESAGDLIVTPEQLAGEYRVAGVGGEGIDLPYGITASITGDTIHLTAECVNIEWVT